MSKDRLNIMFDKDVADFIKAHFTKGNYSEFINSCVKKVIKKVIKPEDSIRDEIRYHEKKRKFHTEMIGELGSKLQILQGKAKVVSTDVFNKFKENSNKVTSYEEKQMNKVKNMLNHAPLTAELTKDGAIVGQNTSAKEMRKEALRIIEK